MNNNDSEKDNDLLFFNGLKKAEYIKETVVAILMDKKYNERKQLKTKNTTTIINNLAGDMLNKNKEKLKKMSIVVWAVLLRQS